MATHPRRNKATTPTADGLLTAQQTANYLNISLNTLWRMEKKGQLRPYRTGGGHRRYSMAQIQDYLNQSVKN